MIQKGIVPNEHNALSNVSWRTGNSNTKEAKKLHKND